MSMRCGRKIRRPGISRISLWRRRALGSLPHCGPGAAWCNPRTCDEHISLSEAPLGLFSSTSERNRDTPNAGGRRPHGASSPRRSPSSHLGPSELVAAGGRRRRAPAPGGTRASALAGGRQVKRVHHAHGRPSARRASSDLTRPPRQTRAAPTAPRPSCPPLSYRLTVGASGPPVRAPWTPARWMRAR
jgi:hypothetical protein